MFDPVWYYTIYTVICTLPVECIWD